MDELAVSQRPVVIAHRGGAPREIENSAAAFRHAVAVGADALECDVRQTADGVLVLLHDAQVRLEGGDRLAVRQTPYAVLKRALPWLLRLEEFLEEFGGQALLNLDLKGAGYEATLARVLRSWGDPGRVFFTAQSVASLRRLAGLVPEAVRGLSRGQALSRWPRRLDKRGTATARWPLALQIALIAGYARADVVTVHHHVVSPRLVRWLRRRGYLVTTWTVDEREEARRVIHAGVWALTTNQPDDLLPGLGYPPSAAYAGCDDWREAFSRVARAGPGGAGRTRVAGQRTSLRDRERA
jgi:glycerophosphoryl diester phosphodiesterase